MRRRLISLDDYQILDKNIFKHAEHINDILINGTLQQCTKCKRKQFFIIRRNMQTYIVCAGLDMAYIYDTKY